MILHGNQRGGSKNLALHLMKDENEHVEVHDVRGFISRDVMGALTESYALSRATKCRQHLYSLSLNPPKDKDVTDEDFIEAVELAEQRLGLSKQPRIIVFHEKYGSDGELRKHAHAVWSRIDTSRMKAVQLSYTKRKLQDVSRELYIRHGWRMPHGFINKHYRDPKNFSLAEWQQAKRQDKDPKVLKAMFQERWSTSDSLSGFGHALEEQGFILAKGDRRGFVAVDYKGEVYSISRWVGVKAKAVREKLGEPDNLPTVENAHAKAATMTAYRLKELRDVQNQKVERFKAVFAKRRAVLAAKKAQEQERLKILQRQRQAREDAHRRARIRRGLIGFLDRLTGRRRQMELLNAQELNEALKRDVSERRVVSETYEQQDQNLTAQDRDKQQAIQATNNDLRRDIKWLERSSDLDQSGRDDDKNQQTRNRDGPEPEM
ncbi:relaxase/mobilization nuclease domain-containing protein [Lentilitoribacter sp. EG35]|uniref:relaxase/mobilization nuclease domain-containing protein n=1 Tax=Lentilitoribacter sp. EG35 TaxID=3234192 RepID=UPI003460AC2F